MKEAFAALFFLITTKLFNRRKYNIGACEERRKVGLRASHKRMVESIEHLDATLKRHR